MTIFVTGGAGYIGSHTCVELLENGYDVVVADNLCNSSCKAMNRVEQITGKTISYYEIDIRNEHDLETIFSAHKIDIVIHFAGFKKVGESVSIPLDYYDNNIGGTIALCKVMKKYNCKNIIFSSSATVYGKMNKSPLLEEFTKGKCTNPYGWTKWMIEQILTDLYMSDHSWNVTLLRYFNPIGAHQSGLIGEDPKGLPNNLLPYLAEVAVGKLPYLNVFGHDYNTPDGTGVRDYIHVVDLARGHMAAINNMKGINVYNLGTGRGYSVLEVIRAFEKVCGHIVPYEFKARRAGDIDVCYSNSEKAERELGWVAEYDIEKMCEDAWRWQKNNPNGYNEAVAT